MHVKKGDTLAFLDFCRITQYVSPINRFYTISKTAQNTYGPESIKPLSCQPILSVYEDDATVWNNIVPSNQYFKCAKIGDGTYVTYVVRLYIKGVV